MNLKYACRATFPKKGVQKQSRDSWHYRARKQAAFPTSSQHLQSMFHWPKQLKIIWFAGEVQAIHQSMMFLHLLIKYPFFGTLPNQIHLAPNYELGRVHLNVWFWIKMVVSIWRFDSNSVRHTEDDPNTWNPQDDLMTSARAVSFGIPQSGNAKSGSKIHHFLPTPKRSVRSCFRLIRSCFRLIILSSSTFFFNFSCFSFPPLPLPRFLWIHPVATPRERRLIGIPSSTSWLLQLTMVVWVESLGDMCTVGSIH